jgi:hypothetical protein
MSATATWIMCIVIVGSLIGMLSVITLASRHPAFRNPRVPSMSGPVLGGVHLSEGGRSVAPTDNEPAELTETELGAMRAAETGQPGASRPEVPVQPMPAAPGRVPEQAIPAQRSDELEQTVPLRVTGRSDQAEHAVPRQASGQADQAEQAVPRQRSGQADRSEKTTTDR